MPPIGERGIAFIIMEMICFSAALTFHEVASEFQLLLSRIIFIISHLFVNTYTFMKNYGRYHFYITG